MGILLGCSINFVRYCHDAHLRISIIITHACVCVCVYVPHLGRRVGNNKLAPRRRVYVTLLFSFSVAAAYVTYGQAHGTGTRRTIIITHCAGRLYTIVVDKWRQRPTNGGRDDRERRSVAAGKVVATWPYTMVNNYTSRPAIGRKRRVLLLFLLIPFRRWRVDSCGPTERTRRLRPFDNKRL